MAKVFVVVGATSGIGQQVAAKLAPRVRSKDSRARAAELAPKIRVNAVAPSLTDTPLAESLLNQPAKRENAARRHALQRVGTPSDVSSAVCFLLSKNSNWVTGQVLAVDGGLSRIRSLSQR